MRMSTICTHVSVRKPKDFFLFVAFTTRVDLTVNVDRSPGAVTAKSAYSLDTRRPKVEKRDHYIEKELTNMLFLC